MRSIVFCDIDGVLNDEQCYRRFRSAMNALTLDEARINYEHDINQHLLFHPDYVARLNEITRRSGACIVLSSSWRNYYWAERDRFRRLFKIVGVVADVLDFTPRESGGERGDQIAAWLQESRDEAHIVVLDDDSDMDAVRPWFVHVVDGLRDHDVQAALRVLGGEPWRAR